MYRSKLLCFTLATGLAVAAFGQSNDNFAGRTTVYGRHFVTPPVALDTATIEATQPADHYGKDIWYSWTAPDNVDVSLSAEGSELDTTFNVYVGDELAGLTPILRTDDEDTGFTAVKGLTYHIALGSYYANSKGRARFALNTEEYSPGIPVLGPVTTSAGPQNDAIANAESIPALPRTLLSYHDRATRETGEREHGYRTVWYKYTARTNETVSFRTFAETSYSVVSVYHGGTFEQQTQVISSDRATSSFVAAAGETYFIAVGEYYSSSAYGAKRIFVSSSPLITSGQVVAPSIPTNRTPRNDNFANRQTLAGSRLTAVIYNHDATRESFEPEHGYSSVWFSWTAEQTGSLRLSTGGDDFLRRVTVYTGSKMGALTQVGQSTDPLAVDVTAGTTYHIAVASYYSGSSGQILLHLTAPGKLAAPTINRPPSAISVQEGEQALISVTASGPALIYQWKKNGIAVPGATAPTLLLPRARQIDSGNYSVTVSNVAGAMTSTSAALTVTPFAPLPNILADPTSLTREAGAAASFTVSATSATALSYQWLHGGVPIAGATSAVFTINSVQPSHAGGYTVLVTNSGGTVISAEAVLLVRTAGTTAPANDAFADRIRLSGTTFSIEPVALDNATIEAGQPNDHFGKDVWYTWTAPDDLDVTLSAESSDSSIYTTINVYVGDSLADLQAVRMIDGKTLSFLAVKGTTYQIALGSYYANSKGMGGLAGSTISYTSGATVIGPEHPYASTPVNDSFGNARPLAELPLITVTYHDAATREVGERDHGYRTLWYTYTPAENETVNYVIEASTSYSVVGVYYGDSLDRLVAVHVGDDSTGSFVAVAGTTYHIAVAEYYSTSRYGVKRIAWMTSPLAASSPVVGPEQPTEQAPRNDSFERGQLLVGSALTAVIYSSDANRDAFELANGYRSVWFTWTAGSDGTLTLTPADDSFLRRISVYTGSELAALTKVAQADGKVIATVKAGTTYRISAAGYYSNGGGTTLLNLVGPGTTAAPSVSTLASKPAASVGGALTLTAAAPMATTLQWQRNGSALAGQTSASLLIENLQPAQAGIYYAVASNAAGAVISTPAIVGVSSTTKVVGTGSELTPVDIRHPNGNIFDQVLLTGTAETITADLGQVTRTSYIDLDDDIVQVEFSGPGTLTLLLDNATGPALPAKYNQSVSYMKGHASIVITGATEQTHVAVFTVGRATAVNQALFKSDVSYDGFADIAYIAISSANGKFGGVRTANATFFASKGLTGIYAPGVVFTGPVYVSDITAFDSATPVLMLGLATGPTAITGGDLQQVNGKPVQVAGLTQLTFSAGSDSHGKLSAAQSNRGVLEENGTDITANIVVNP